MLNGITGCPCTDLSYLFSLKAEQEGETRLLLECDSSVQDSIQRHLKVYKIRRKVTIGPGSDLSLWAVLPQDGGDCGGDEGPELTAPEKALVWAVDPRTKAMGWRLVTDKQVNPLELIRDVQQGAPEDYHRHRYEIGTVPGFSFHWSQIRDAPGEVKL